MAEEVDIIDLKPDTLLAYTDYIRAAVAAMDEANQAGTAFLWSEGDADRRKRVSEGQVVAELWSGTRPVSIPHGLIHDWIGAISIAGATIRETLALMQDYDNHKSLYSPDVIDSKLISRDGDEFEIFLRLLKKKVITVVLDSYHHVHYYPVDAMRWRCDSQTTRMCEVENARKSKEFVRPPDTGYGFLWRLGSYWRLEERDGAVYVECRAISLTRSIPSALAWIIQPMIKKLPRESLKATLEATRRGVMAGKSISGAVKA